MNTEATAAIRSSLNSSLVNLLDVTWWIIPLITNFGDKYQFLYLIDKEPSCEEETNTEENYGQVREDRRVDGRDVSGHGTDVGNGHDGFGWAFIWKILLINK